MTPDLKKLFLDAFEVFRLYWLAHVRSKTEDYAAHLAFKDAYDRLEDVFHTIGERAEDNGDPVDPRDVKTLAKDAYAALDKLLSDVASASKADVTAGETKILTDAASELENVAGTQKQFIK